MKNLNYRWGEGSSSVGVVNFYKNHEIRYTKFRSSQKINTTIKIWSVSQYTFIYLYV